MLLDSVEDAHTVLAVHHVHCQTPLAEAACAPDPVQVGLIVRVPVLIHGKIKIDDNRHLLNINTCRKVVKGGAKTEESGQETKGATVSYTHPLHVRWSPTWPNSAIWALERAPTGLWQRQKNRTLENSFGKL